MDRLKAVFIEDSLCSNYFLTNMQFICQTELSNNIQIKIHNWLNCIKSFSSDSKSLREENHPHLVISEADFV